MNPRDHELEHIRRARSGDLRAYGVLVRLYEDRLFRTAYRILHNREDAEDCLQETFVRTWEHLSNLSDPEAFGGWVYRILSNLALDCLEKKSRQRRIEKDLREEIVRLPKSRDRQSPREVLRCARETERIESAIRELAPRQKVVFVLRHYQGLKLREIADIPTRPRA